RNSRRTAQKNLRIPLAHAAGEISIARRDTNFARRQRRTSTDTAFGCSNKNFGFLEYLQKPLFARLKIGSVRRWRNDHTDPWMHHLTFENSRRDTEIFYSRIGARSDKRLIDLRT